MSSFLASAAAVLVTFPLGALTYNFFFLRRLSSEERTILRDRRSNDTFKSRSAGGLIASLGLVFATTNVTATVPFWALVLAWAITWPLAALSYAHMSLGLLKRDPTAWREVLNFQRRPQVGSVIVHMFVALMPAAILLSHWKS